MRFNNLYRIIWQQRIEYKELIQMRASINRIQPQLHSHSASINRIQPQLHSNSALHNHPPHGYHYEESQKPNTSQVFVNRNEQLNDIPLSHSKQFQPSPQPKTRRELNELVFALVLLSEITFTVYPWVTFSRLNGQYEFFLMGFTFTILYLVISAFLLKDFDQFLPLYSLLDPLMVLVFALSGTYLIPYILMQKYSVPQILQLVAFFICNLATVGNLRVMLLYMEWGTPKVIFYKLAKMLSVLFYLAFGAYYRLKEISFSKGTNPDIDSKVQFIVLLFVLSGFVFQLQIFNKLSLFDKTYQLKTDYEIVTEEQFFYQTKSEIDNLYYQQQLPDDSMIKQPSKKPHFPSVTLKKFLNPYKNHMKIVHNLKQNSLNRT